MSDDLTIPNPDFRGNRAGRYGTGKSQARQGMDTDTRRLMIFAGGLGAVLAVLIGASALIAHRSTTDVPVVFADPRPIRVKPDNPGGMKIDGAENDVFSAGADTTDSKLAPAPEAPDRMALRTAAAPPPPVVQIPPPVIPAPPKAAVVASAAPAKPSPVAQPPAAVVATHPTVTDGHPTMVQLAALTTEDAAHAEWQQLSRRMPDLLNGRQPVFLRSERDGHVFWRVRMAGFADVAQAHEFCGRVRAKGAGCSVADF